MKAHRRRRLSVATAALSCALFAHAVPSNAQTCLPQPTELGLSCDGAPRLQTTSGKPDAAPPVTTLPAPPMRPTKPGAPDEQTFERDSRREMMAEKSGQLLITEIQGLESILSDTPKKAKDRPKLIRRLAESYVELENAALVAQTVAEIAFSDAKRAGDQAAMKKHADERKKQKKIVSGARKRAIKYYLALVKNHPGYCSHPHPSEPAKSKGCTDEVLYYLAFEYEMAKQYDKARKVYFELIQSYPTSPYLPQAYLAFGELFFQEAQSDPSKWTLAQQAYEEVIQYPPPDNGAFGYAHYKLGYIHWNQDRFPEALSSFKAAIEFGTRHGNLPNARSIAKAARRDLVTVYSLTGDPQAAFAFFKPLSGDPAGEQAKTLAMMNDLGQAYLDTGGYPEAIALYRDLERRDEPHRACVYQGHISEATMALYAGDKARIVAQLRSQLAASKKLAASGANAEDKLACANATAPLVTETAMAWHLEAVGSGGTKGTGDADTMALAADLYEAVVTHYDATEFAKLEFPRIHRDDWPTWLGVRYLMADLLYEQEQWAGCAKAFDAVAAADPDGENADRAAIAAVYCYQKMYLTEHEGGSDREGIGQLPSAEATPTNASDQYVARPYTEAQEGMLGAFERFLCRSEPEPGDREAYDDYVEIKYARARTFFEAQRWEDAARAFREVALQHADHEVGVFAAHLYLESINVLSEHSDPPRKGCFARMATDIPKLTESYCGTDARRAEHADACKTLVVVGLEVRRKAIEEKVAKADEGGVNALSLYREAGDDYLALWNEHYEQACSANDETGCKRAEEILYNAGQAYQAGRLIAKAIAVRKKLVDPRYGLDSTDPAKTAMYQIAGNYQAIAVYDEAAGWYERFALENPKRENAPTALMDATVLRLGLGQADRAIENAEAFQRNYGASRGGETARLSYAIAAHFADNEDYASVESRLKAAMPLIERSGTLDVRIGAHAVLGRALAQRGNDAAARLEYERVRAAWSDPARGTAALDAVGGSDAERARRLGKVLDAVGEATFFFAELERKRVDAIEFPAYRGSGTRADVLAHIDGPVKQWIGQKRPAIERAEAEYLRVLDISPMPPPRWVIASSARSGQMWGRFVAEFRAAPVPREWHGDGFVPGTDLSYAEVRGMYTAGIDAASQPQKLRAKDAFEKCLAVSVKFQFFDEHAQSCETWLSTHFPAQHHAVDEWRTTPNRVSSGLSDRGQALEMDGQPVLRSPSPDGQPVLRSPSPDGPLG